MRPTEEILAISEGCSRRERTFCATRTKTARINRVPLKQIRRQIKIKYQRVQVSGFITFARGTRMYSFHTVEAHNYFLVFVSVRGRIQRNDGEVRETYGPGGRARIFLGGTDVPLKFIYFHIHLLGARMFIGRRKQQIVV